MQAHQSTVDDGEVANAPSDQSFAVNVSGLSWSLKEGLFSLWAAGTLIVLSPLSTKVRAFLISPLEDRYFA